jgi:hypothetical protein
VVARLISSHSTPYEDRAAIFECRAQAERVGGSDVNKFVGVLEGDRDRFLVDTLEEPIRYTKERASASNADYCRGWVPSVVRVFDVVESLVVGGLNGERSDRGPVNCSWRARGLGSRRTPRAGGIPRCKDPIWRDNATRADQRRPE